MFFHQESDTRTILIFRHKLILPSQSKKGMSYTRALIHLFYSRPPVPTFFENREKFIVRANLHIYHICKSGNHVWLFHYKPYAKHYTDVLCIPYIWDEVNSIMQKQGLTLRNAYYNYFQKHYLYSFEIPIDEVEDYITLREFLGPLFAKSRD